MLAAYGIEQTTRLCINVDSGSGDGSDVRSTTNDRNAGASFMEHALTTRPEYQIPGRQHGYVAMREKRKEPDDATLAPDA